MLSSIFRQTATLNRGGNSALAFALAVGFFLAPNAQAQSCGGENERPCKFLERVPSCNKGLIETIGKCEKIKLPEILPKILPGSKPDTDQINIHQKPHIETPITSGEVMEGEGIEVIEAAESFIQNIVLKSVLAAVNAANVFNENETRARYNREKDEDPETQANGLQAGKDFLAAVDANPGGGGGPGTFDPARRHIMAKSLRTEHEIGSGYDTVEWYVAASGSLVAGYSHGYGYAMSYDGKIFRCQTAETHTFVGGITAGAGLTEEWTFSKTGLGGVAGESNGYNAGFAVGVGVTHGMEWDAEAPHGRSFTWGLTPVGADINAEYNHSWTSTGGTIDCDDISWDGKKWETSHEG